LYKQKRNDMKTLSNIFGILLFLCWFIILILMCGEPTFDDTPTQELPMWEGICFIILFLCSPFVSMYLLRDKK
jgi:hypothetical protein